MQLFSYRTYIKKTKTKIERKKMEKAKEHM